MSDELREQLADVQHEIWAHWMRYLFSQCLSHGTGGKLILSDSVERWKRQMKTPYAALTNRERESDREQADKVLAIVQPEIDQLRAALAAATQRAEEAEAVRVVYRALLVEGMSEVVRLSGAADTHAAAVAYYYKLFELAQESGALAACNQAAVEAVAKAAGVPIEYEGEVKP